MATRVAVIAADELLRGRLRRLAAEVGTLDISIPDRVAAGEMPRLAGEVEVAVLAFGATENAALGTIRSLRRRHPGLHLVVVGRSTMLFEEAFDAGADAWVGEGADDDTLLAAIHGRWVT